jgi:hypothetical protein
LVIEYLRGYTKGYCFPKKPEGRKSRAFNWLIVLFSSRQVNVMILALLTYALRLLGISFVGTAEESLVLEVSSGAFMCIYFVCVC